MAGKPETRGLAREAIGSARLTAFGVSNVAPSRRAVAGGLVIVVAYAGFAAPLVVLIALVASLVLRGQHRGVRPPAAHVTPARCTPITAAGWARPRVS